MLPALFIFIRHAIAVPADEFAGTDAARPLTPCGARRAGAVCRRLLKLYRPTRVVASPYVRAVETARLLVREMAVDGVAIETAEALTPDGTLDGWQAFVRATEFTAGDVVAVIGHEPSLSAFFAAQLGLPGILPFKKAGIGIVKPRGLEDGDLVAFVPPKVWLTR